MKTILVTVSLLQTVKKIWELGYLRPYTQAFNARNHNYAKAIQSLATVRWTFKYITKQSFTKHIFAHILNTVSRLGAHTMQMILIYWRRYNTEPQN